MTPPTSSSLPVAGLLASLLLLAGCSLAPPYQRPAAPVPEAYKEAPANTAETAPADGSWKLARPADEASRGAWWEVFQDERLNALEAEAQAANQDLKAAAARLGQARALEQNARAARYPQVNVGLGPTRQLASPAAQGLPADADTSPVTLWRGQATFAYEADLFGRIGTTVDAARFDSERQGALFHSTLLALQADVAQAYFMVRELDALHALYRDTMKLREETLALFQRRFDAGDISDMELARAQTELAAAQAEADGVVRQRAVAEHALAILLGKTPAEFSLEALPLGRIAIQLPAGLPSSLLERRPDIAAAERAMAAANARIGAAQAAFFPSLNLTGSIGYEAHRAGDLFKSASRAFVLGPLVGTLLSLPVFDGGARAAGVDRANAVYDEEVARYRQTVLQAFKEVEDGLINLRLLESQQQAQSRAVSAAERAARLSHIQYREGAISYLGVIDADRSALQQRRASVTLDGERARATVSLIRALGGGWG